MNLVQYGTALIDSSLNVLYMNRFMLHILQAEEEETVKQKLHRILYSIYSQNQQQNISQSINELLAQTTN